MLKFYKLWPYATIIPGQSTGKSSESPMGGFPAGSDSSTAIISWACPRIDRLTDSCGSNTDTNQLFPFPQQQSSEKIIKFETSLEERVALINVLSVGQTVHFPHKVSPNQDKVQLPAQVMGIYSLKSTDFCTEMQQIQAGHWCPSTEKGLQPAGFSHFQMGKAAVKVKIPAVKESLSLGQKENSFLERGGKKTRRNNNTYNLKVKKSDCLPVSLHLSMAAAESA